MTDFGENQHDEIKRTCGYICYNTRLPASLYVLAYFHIDRFNQRDRKRVRSNEHSAIMLCIHSTRLSRVFILISILMVSYTCLAFDGERLRRRVHGLV